MDASEDEMRVLLKFLQHQRDSILSIVTGLAEEDWHRSVVPSGWTAAGFVGHLGGAERYWFHHVVAGTDADHPFDDALPPYDPAAPFTIDRPSAEVLTYYRDMCRRSDEVLAGVSLSAPPVGEVHDPELKDDVKDVRWIVVHMIEETAAHSGHLEIARELLDGRTGLGLR